MMWWSRSGFLLSFAPLAVGDDKNMIERVNIIEIPEGLCSSFVVLSPWCLFLLSFCSVSEDAASYVARIRK